MNTYLQGEKIVLTAAFSDDDAAAVTPDTVVIRLVPVHDGHDATELAATEVTTGTFEAEFDSTSAQPGTWTYGAVATGTGQATGTNRLRINRNPLL